MQEVKRLFLWSDDVWWREVTQVQTVAVQKKKKKKTTRNKQESKPLLCNFNNLTL